MITDQIRQGHRTNPMNLFQFGEHREQKKSQKNSLTTPTLGYVFFSNFQFETPAWCASFFDQSDANQVERKKILPKSNKGSSLIRALKATYAINK